MPLVAMLSVLGVSQHNPQLNPDKDPGIESLHFPWVRKGPSFEKPLVSGERRGTVHTAGPSSFSIYRPAPK